MERRFVKVEKGLGPQGRIAVVRFDRGDNINALSQQAMRELRDVPRDFEDDLETSVVILTGSAKAFSAGFDLKDPEGRQRDTLSVGERIHRQRLGPRMCKAWQEMDQVTIAAIEGHCIGGGAALVVSLDFRFCGKSAHFRIPEVELGMNMSWGSIPRMLALMGPARTKQAVILASDRISAAEALDWGLVENVVEDGQALGGRHGIRRADRPPAADPGAHDQAHGQPLRPRARRSRQPHGRRPERADRADRGLQGGNAGLPREAQAGVQGAVKSSVIPTEPSAARRSGGTCSVARRQEEVLDSPPLGGFARDDGL